MQLEELILGTTEAIEAEYGYNTDMPFSVVHMYDGEFLQIEGFLTRAEAKAAYEWGQNSSTIAYTSIA